MCILFQLGKRFSGPPPVQIDKYSRPTKAAPEPDLISPKMETESLEKELAELKALFRDCKLDERSPESKEKCLMLRNLVYK